LQSLDRLNVEFGRDKIKLAVQGDGKEWKLRQERLTKRYTTNWNEIIEVLAGGKEKTPLKREKRKKP